MYHDLPYAPVVSQVSPITPESERLTNTNEILQFIDVWCPRRLRTLGEPQAPQAPNVMLSLSIPAQPLRKLDDYQSCPSPLELRLRGRIPRPETLNPKHVEAATCSNVEHESKVIAATDSGQVAGGGGTVSEDLGSLSVRFISL